MSSLSHWVAQRHLADQSLAGYQAAFELSRWKAISIDNFLRPELAKSLRQFVALNAHYETRYGLYSEGQTDRARWEAASEHDRFFLFDRMSRAREGTELDPSTIAFCKFRHSVSGGVFNDYFRSVTQIPIGPATIPQAFRYTPGHFLKTHTDDAHGRRLAAILYLSEGQAELADGGGLSILSEGELVQTIAVGFNRLVCFDVTKSEHRIEALAASQMRLSISWWFTNGTPALT